MKTAVEASPVEPFIPTERDIWLTAGLMLQEFGSHAVIVASQRADKALASAELDYLRLWKRVVRAIAAITETEGETLH